MSQGQFYAVCGTTAAVGAIVVLSVSGSMDRTWPLLAMAFIWFVISRYHGGEKQK